MNQQLSIRRYDQFLASAWLVAREETGPPSYRREPETIGDWSGVHARIVELGAERAHHERDLCRWLLAAERLGVAARAGYASLREYARRIVGLNGRQTDERLRVGRALPFLPLLDEALATGRLCWSVVRELTRVATGETEGAWLAWAEGKGCREVERAVAMRHRGDGPADRGDKALLRYKLRFEVRSETMALFRDLEARVRSDLGDDIGDDALLFEIARRALGGPDDEGRASYQVAVTRCGDCGATSLDAGGQSHAVDDTIAEMTECDSQHIGLVTPHVGASTQARATQARATQTIPPAVRRHVVRRDRKRCVVPGCQNHRFLDVHHLDLRSEGGGHDPERLCLLCGAHHRSVHRGHLYIEGTASTGFVVRHADGTPYGRGVSPSRLDLARLAFGALRNLGFSRAEARRRVDAALGMADALVGLDEFIRAALRSAI